MPYKKIITLFFLMFSVGSGYAGNGRETLPFNKNWQFYFAYNFEQNITKQKIDLPHTWNAAETLKGVAAYNRTSAIYENTLNVTEEMKGKRLFLYFEGVNSVAAVLLNNKFVNEHKGGYTGFCFEITNFVKQGANTVIVQASNAYRLDVIPLHGDFNVYGGIHRPVSLIITGQNCISPLDHGSSGIYISQQQVSAKSAKIKVLTKLSLVNNTGLSIRTEIYDKKKNVVASAIANLMDSHSAQYSQELNLNNPHLWDGKSDAYLYTVAVSLWKNEQLIDKVIQPLGLRFFHVDPDKGFFLNGKYLDLYGAGRHEDLASKGSALSNADQDNDMELIKELGATAMRLTHYPQNKYFYDLCDRNGIILWSEIPFVGPGGYTGTGYMKNKVLEDNIKTMLRELIRQNYNHPSIFFWGIFNELKLDYDDPEPFIRELDALVKQEDPGRLTTLASNLKQKEFNGLTDLMGWNKYYGWYGGNFDDIAKWADETHQIMPLVPISVSEYGAGASPFKHIEELTKPNPSGHFHPEEWQTAFHEKHWAALKQRPFVWGKFIWVLTDFGSSIRTEGDHNGINDKGLVTYDRKIKKDAFYFYKANWNPEPILYIAERRNNIRRKKTANIKVFSNMQTVELWLNGKFYSSKNTNNLKTVLWENVELQPGKNTILVKSIQGGKVLQDTCSWRRM